jgi:hypothetical protein
MVFNSTAELSIRYDVAKEWNMGSNYSIVLFEKGKKTDFAVLDIGLTDDWNITASLTQVAPKEEEIEDVLVDGVKIFVLGKTKIWSYDHQEKKYDDEVMENGSNLVCIFKYFWI